MSSLRVRLIDRNRFSKRYPLVRAPVRTTYYGDSDFAVEVASVFFDNVDSQTLNFDAPFLDANYQILAVARNSVETGTGTANVNVYVDDKTLTSIRLVASSNFTGYVDVFAVRIA